MTFLVIQYLTIFLYLTAVFQHWRGFVRSCRQSSLSKLIPVFALFLHALVLHSMIDSEYGNNLTFVNLLSQSIWFAALLNFFLSGMKWFMPLSLAVYFMAAGSVFLLIVLPGAHFPVVYSALLVFHVILSLIILSLYLLSALQAMWLVLQNYMIKTHVKTSVRYQWPALESMEKLLFQLILLGFISLTILIVLSGFSFAIPLWQEVWPKLLLVLLTWLVSAILLVGRYCYGWRGIFVVRWTWLGLTCLFAALLFAIIKAKV